MILELTILIEKSNLKINKIEVTTLLQELRTIININNLMNVVNPKIEDVNTDKH